MNALFEQIEEEIQVGLNESELVIFKHAKDSFKYAKASSDKRERETEAAINKTVARPWPLVSHPPRAQPATCTTTSSSSASKSNTSSQKGNAALPVLSSLQISSSKTPFNAFSSTISSNLKVTYSKKLTPLRDVKPPPALYCVPTKSKSKRSSEDELKDAAFKRTLKEMAVGHYYKCLYLSNSLIPPSFSYC